MLAEELNRKESSGILSAVDRMREILRNEKIDLPEIVVVGDQSVGKSSVLEAVCGIQLPRAQNICTRCPLELRIKTSADREYAIIRSGGWLEDEGEVINDMDEIQHHVTRVTNEIAGEGTNVSSTPIYLTVYKRNITFDLTLVDLPGITRNPLPGQPKDIHSQILNLINKYIEPSTAIVLHVIPASVDFTTSESMKLAKEFDPDCRRQLIAASKIDKYDKGIAEKLMGIGAGSMQLQLGCVAVLNRNQGEIDENISFDEMRRREKDFFTRHNEAFQSLPDEYKGVDQLVRKLAHIQQERIRSTLPGIIEDLRKQIREKKAELKSIPPSMNSEHDCWTKFMSMVNAFRESVRDKVNGDYDIIASLPAANALKIELSNKDCRGSSFMDVKRDASCDSKYDDDRIAYCIHRFQREFQKEISEHFPDFFSPAYHGRVLRAINDASGVTLPNFPSYRIIERLLHAELQRLPSICDKLIQHVHEYLKVNLLKIFHRTFDPQYASLNERIKRTIIEQVDAVAERASERVDEALAMEHRIFTMNKAYMLQISAAKNEKSKCEDDLAGNNPYSSSTAPSNVHKVMKKKHRSIRYSDNEDSTAISAQETVGKSYILTFNESLAAHDIQVSLESYCQVVQDRIVDSISQMCYYHFITNCALIIDRSLTTACSPSDLVRYMKEPADQTKRREKLKQTIKAYEDALRLGEDAL